MHSIGEEMKGGIQAGTLMAGQPASSRGLGGKPLSSPRLITAYRAGNVQLYVVNQRGLGGFPGYNESQITPIPTDGGIMSSVPSRQYSYAEYLARERTADHRSEYFQGEIFSMAGGSRRHARICDNLVASMLEKLRGKPCRAYSSSLRVKVEATGLATYPDLSIVCGEEKFDDEAKDTLLNPRLIFEVLSPSTERYDRGRKFNNYKQISTLEEYLLVSQTDPRVERITHKGDVGWVLAVTLGLDSTIEFPSLGCSLTLAEIYEGVDFSEV